MARREGVAAPEALTPWNRPEFRSGLARLSASTASAARRFATDAVTLSDLAAQVPRCRGDETGGTPWTSFRREVAVARSVSDQAAAAEIRTALRLTSVLPHTFGLLCDGHITVARARAFVDELDAHDDHLAAQLDAELAHHAARLAPWRIEQEVRRAVLRLDPDSAAQRTAGQNAARNVQLHPQDDGQATVVMTGPATPLTRWHTTLDTRARALRAAGDPRTLDALRFDLAVSTYPCSSHSPADPSTTDPSTTVSGTAGPGPGTPDVPAQRDGAPAGLRPSGVKAASTDCRMSRPVQATIVVPVQTALGLSNEPGWLDGYGWLAAPTSRTVLLDAELRRACTDSSTGQLLGLEYRLRRPPPTPTGLRGALLALVDDDLQRTDTGWRTEPDHDPSEGLRAFTTLRDRSCDGPIQPNTPAGRCDQDHDRAHPDGPTAAWNLASRSRRTHQLKHYGWSPQRTATSTRWTSPAGQTFDVPHHHRPAPGIDRDPPTDPPNCPTPSSSPTPTPTSSLHPATSTAGPGRTTAGPPIPPSGPGVTATTTASRRSDPLTAAEPCAVSRSRALPSTARPQEAPAC